MLLNWLNINLFYLNLLNILLNLFLLKIFIGYTKFIKHIKLYYEIITLI